MCVNFANPEAREGGATSLLEAEGGGGGGREGCGADDDDDGVALELESFLLSATAATAAAAEELGLRMLASGTMSSSLTQAPGRS